MLSIRQHSVFYKKNWLPYLILLVLQFCSVPSFAGQQDTLLLTPNKHEYSLVPVTRYLEDPTNSLTIRQLLDSTTDKSWKPVNSSSPGFGFSESTYWFRINLLNLDTPHRDFFIELHYPLLGAIDFYLVQQEKVLDKVLTGTNYPFAHRPFKFRTFIYKPQLPIGQPASIYIRVKSDGSLFVPVRLWHEHIFYIHDQQELFIHGLYFGILLIFALYHLLLFLTTRGATYIYYAIYIIAFGLFQASLFGLGYQYLWPGSVTLQHFSIPLFMLIALLAALRFAHHFLHLQINCPRGQHVLHAIALLALLLIIGLPFISYSIVTQLSLLLELVSAAMLLAASLIVWYRERDVAGYFLFGWSIFLLSIIISTIEKLGWGAQGDITDEVTQLGIVVQIVILSLGLARRLQNETKQRIALQQQTNEELSRQVKARTQELEEANRRLDTLSHCDGLTGLQNRRSFDEEINKQFKAATRTKTPLSLAMLDIDLFKKVNDKYGHQVGDSCLKVVAELIKNQVKRPLDTACRYGGEEFALILPDTDQKGVTHIAELIRQQLESTTYLLNNEQLTITISIGTATLIPGQDDTADKLVKLADAALYQAKEGGRNRVVSV